MGCDAFIKINLTEDRKQLQIKDFKATHVGHKGSEAFFELLPQNKKLSNEEEAEVINLLQLRCDKKFLQDKIHQDFKKPWSRKDISNLVTKYKDDDDADTLVKAVQLLRQTYKADVSVLHEDNEFKGLYFSTTEMREAMSLWPEIVFIDGTYKLLRRGLTLMLLLVEDSVGLSKVVGAALLAREDRATFEWFLQCFKKENLIPCSKMQCMMGDKDLLKRDLLKEIFPNIPIYICLFHVLRTFGREVSREKMDITKQQREISLRFLDSLAKSSSQTKYDRLYGEFSQSAPTPVIHYFNKNWHPIRDEWTRYSMVHGNLGNRTNNRLESVNSKIKQVVKKKQHIGRLCAFIF